jgi:hypothetical protein
MLSILFIIRRKSQKILRDESIPLLNARCRHEDLLQRLRGGRRERRGRGRNVHLTGLFGNRKAKRLDHFVRVGETILGVDRRRFANDVAFARRQTMQR